MPTPWELLALLWDDPDTSNMHIVLQWEDCDGEEVEVVLHVHDKIVKACLPALRVRAHGRHATAMRACGGRQCAGHCSVTLTARIHQPPLWKCSALQRMRGGK
jgi:hypothetical protein